jgi:hypothetical protein
MRSTSPSTPYAPPSGQDERLHHHRHPRAVALRLQPEHVLDAVATNLGVARHVEQVDDDAGGVETHRLAHRVFDHPAVEQLRQLTAVHVRQIGAQHERGLVSARP